MSDFYREPDRIEREHILLDLHKVLDGTKPAPWFVMNYSEQLEALLRAESNTAEVDQANADATEAEAKFKTLYNIVETAVSDFDAMVYEPRETAGQFCDRVSEKIISKLENAL